MSKGRTNVYSGLPPCPKRVLDKWVLYVAKHYEKFGRHPRLPKSTGREPWRDAEGRTLVEAAEQWRSEQCATTVYGRTP